jgi:hypothetical protein
MIRSVLGKRFWSAALPLAGPLLAAAAAGATTLAVSASPQTAGTASAPQPQALTLTLSKIGYANNSPSRTLVAVTEQLPSSFKDQLSLFGDCPSGDFENLNSSPPPCPSNSLVGIASFTAYVPSLLVTANAAGYIYKVSASQVEAWVHITKPAQFSVAVPGTVGSASSSGGPSVNWNLSAAIDFGVTADITMFQTGWDVHRVAERTPAAPHRTSKAKPKKAKKHAKPKASSKHHKAKPKKRSHKHGKPKTSPPTTVVTTQTASAFESTSCPAAGSWSFSAELRYHDGSSETVQDSLACAPAQSGTTTTTTTPQCTPVLFLCLPGLRRAGGAGVTASRASGTAGRPKLTASAR